jgi:uncharacterized protein involved in response to NO
VAILHVGYAFIPIGFVLATLAAAMPEAMPMSAVLHTWTVGAIGTMTLAVMTRASLGHTGHALHADRSTIFIYAAVVIAAFARVAAALWPVHAHALLHVAGAGWIAAFGGFALCYGQILLRPRKDR